MPIISSFTIWLELTLEIPGVANSLMGMLPTGALSPPLQVLEYADKPLLQRSHVVGLAAAQVPRLVLREGLRWSRGPWRGDWWLYWYHLGELARSHFQPWGPGWLRDVPSSHHWLGWVQHLLPSHKHWGSPLWCWLRHAVCLGEVGSTRGLQTILLFFLGESHPPKDLFISEGEVPFHLLPQLQNASC